MSALSARKIAIVRTLVETAPDKIVGDLLSALSQIPVDSPLVGVRELVDGEARDRRLRDRVFAPVGPMCVADGVDSRRLIFPRKVIPLAWRGLKASAAEDIAEAALHMLDYVPGESSAEPFDRLVALAAEGLRARDGEAFQSVAAHCDAARPDGAATFAACLDLAPVVRKAALRLDDWIGHVGEDTSAAARLAYKDAVTVADDAGPRFFEMLAAQLDHPWMVLRIISAVMDKPNERYLADSEMAGFAERVMAQIDANLARVAGLDPNAGPAAGREAGDAVELVTRQITELEAGVDLGRGQGWGARVALQKKARATVVEARLTDAEKAVQTAMPTQAAKLARIRTRIPKLSAAPDENAVRRAITLLTFVDQIRASANYGGFASARAKLLEKLGDALDLYVEEVLHHLKLGDVPEEIGRAYLAVAADVSRLIRDAKAADLIRRRAAALNAPDVRIAAAN